MKTPDANALPSQPSSAIAGAAQPGSGADLHAPGQSHADSPQAHRPGGVATIADRPRKDGLSSSVANVQQYGNQTDAPATAPGMAHIGRSESERPIPVGMADESGTRHDSVAPSDIRAILDRADAAFDSRRNATGRTRADMAAAFAMPREPAPSSNAPRRMSRTGIVNDLMPDCSIEQDDADHALPANANALISSEWDNPDGRERKGAGKKPRHHREPSNRDRNIGSAMEDDDALPEIAGNIAGRGDRLHYLAMAAASGTALLRAPKMDVPGALPAVKPQSRADCERRCGSDGFCDPSSTLGCGGEYCGRQYFDV